MKVILSFLFLVMGCQPLFAATQAANKDAQFTLNRASPEAMRKYQLGSLVVEQKKWVLKATYDYAIQGGSSAAAINLKGPDGKNAVLPSKAVVHDCIIDVITQPTSSGSATIAIGTGQAANDLKTATAIASYTGRVACIPVGTAASSIKLTADRNPTITVATSNLSGGKFNVLIEYFVSD